MLRPRLFVPTLIAVSLLVVAGCNKPERDTTKADSPNASIAGTEADTETRRAASKAATTSDQRGLARALVAVASTSSTEAEPCERTCGMLGDCLRESDDFRAFEAGGLELECLNLCVHAPDESDARTAFLDCEQRDECGALRSCAEDGWTKLAEVSNGPDIKGITAAADPCKDGCRWMYACMFSGAPPGEGYLDPQLEQQMHYCESTCDDLGQTDREAYAHLASCLPDHCGYGLGDECWNY